MRLPDLARRLVRLADWTVPLPHPWERIRDGAPHSAFGPGSVRPLGWYFEGESAVTVASVDALCEWLLACEYVPDPELFRAGDVWQHPSDFERCRQGDCEDHALWAWRKLTELGVESEFCVGRYRPTTTCGDEWSAERGHAWVMMRGIGGDYLMETVARTREAMVRPLEDVRDAYAPHFSAWYSEGGRLRVAAYGGYLHFARSTELRRRRGDSAPGASVHARPPAR